METILATGLVYAPANPAGEGEGRGAEQTTSAGIRSKASLLADIGPRDTRILSGPIGSGKTRLALRAAVGLCQARRQHVVYVRGREACDELAAKGAADGRDLLHEFGIDRVGERMQAAIPLMAEPRIWVEDPAWLLEHDMPPFFVHWLRRHSPIPCGLVVVDALATWARELHGLVLPAASDDTLAPHQIGALEQKIPRLVVVDDMGPGANPHVWLTTGTQLSRSA